MISVDQNLRAYFEREREKLAAAHAAAQEPAPAPTRPRTAIELGSQAIAARQKRNERNRK